MFLSWISEVVWAESEADFRAAEAAYVQGGAARVAAPLRPARRSRGSAAPDSPVAYAMLASHD